ncbi:MAG: hypothetical protein IT437_02820 [Phycisphaerales bacterium]|nr:hypothetical protein [Phycisphaerales bacterium]
MKTMSNWNYFVGAFFALAVTSVSVAQDWSNAGGNAQRNGRTSEIGPSSATLLWSGGRTSITAWQPVSEGNRVFMVRQTGVPPQSAPTDSPVVAMSLSTGEELWARDLPYTTGWCTWIAGVKNQRVFASRGNIYDGTAAMYALDSATGETLWLSEDLIRATAFDGVEAIPEPRNRSDARRE